MPAARLPLPPLHAAKRPAPGWEFINAPVAVAAPAAPGPAPPKPAGLDEGAQFAAAAIAGARAQRGADSARGAGAFETYELGLAIVRSSRVYANQRRSNRRLPGGSDSTTAACFMLGGTPDSVLSPLVARVSPCDPREERCKAVERVLKDKTRASICALNGENPREARADNLAAVRICEVVADILVAYAAKRLLATLQEVYKVSAEKDDVIRQLRGELNELTAKRRRVAGGQAPDWTRDAARFPPPLDVGHDALAGARTLPPPAALGPGALGPAVPSPTVPRPQSPLPAPPALAFSGPYSASIDSTHWAPPRNSNTG